MGRFDDGEEYQRRPVIKWKLLTRLQEVPS